MEVNEFGTYLLEITLTEISRPDQRQESYGQSLHLFYCYVICFRVDLSALTDIIPSLQIRLHIQHCFSIYQKICLI